VAPVCKKNTDNPVKPRDHYLLRSERPAYITLLCLVRDAAARLPKGFGTRTDICELLKESQFIISDFREEKMSSVVSGALDRLHYEKDPCVKYDSEKKLWNYLHISKKEQDFSN
jgi:nuclear factor related to kappa-B-binding protein